MGATRGIMECVRRPTYEDSMRWFAVAVPELAPLLAGHLADMDELLPYVLFEHDYMRWLKCEVVADRDSPSVCSFLECVDVLLAGPTDEASNLAWIGFVEHLVAGGEREVLSRLEGRLAPVTQAALDEFRQDQERWAELQREFSSCRCRDLVSIDGAATSIYSEHLVWIDELEKGLSVFKCPDTGSFWSSSDRRAGGPVKMRRHADKTAAERMLHAAQHARNR